MAFEEVKEGFKDLKDNTKEYIESNARYYQLWGLKVSSKIASYILIRFLVGICIMLSLLFISLAVAIIVGECLNNMALGFLLVGVFYVLVFGVVLYFKKSLIVKPILKKFSNIFYND